MKVAPNTNYFIDIGNSTIKVSTDGIDVEIFPLNKLKGILKKLKDNKVFAFSSNLTNSVNNVILAHQNKNISFRLLTNLDIENKLKTKDINIKEVGVDILFSMYYLNSLSRNYMLINLGTFLICYVVRNHCLNYVNIDYGINNRMNICFSNLKTNINPEWSWLGTNTSNAIKSSILMQIYGFVIYYKNKMKSTNLDYFLSGNDADFNLNEILNTEFKLTHNPNCSLKGLIKFVNEEFKEE